MEVQGVQRSPDSSVKGRLLRIERFISSTDGRTEGTAVAADTGNRLQINFKWIMTFYALSFLKIIVHKRIGQHGVKSVTHSVIFCLVICQWTFAC